jgi:hypothetical protein
MRTLQIAEDLAFQRRAWIAERVGRAGCGAILLAAVLGVFGVGPLGNARVSSADGSLTVEYPRFAGAQRPLTLHVRLDVAAPRDGELRLWLAREYVEELSIQHITPPPDRVELDAERVTFVFGWRGDAGGAVVAFTNEAERAGTVAGLVGAGGVAVAVRHFLYP